jgi:hypothetical protein
VRSQGYFSPSANLLPRTAFHASGFGPFSCNPQGINVPLLPCPQRLRYNRHTSLWYLWCTHVVRRIMATWQQLARIEYMVDLRVSVILSVHSLALRTDSRRSFAAGVESSRNLTCTPQIAKALARPPDNGWRLRLGWGPVPSYTIMEGGLGLGTVVLPAKVRPTHFEAFLGWRLERWSPEFTPS